MPGLYLLDRAWQSNRGSALLLGVARDARFIAGKLREELASRECFAYYCRLE